MITPILQWRKSRHREVSVFLKVPQVVKWRKFQTSEAPEPSLLNRMLSGSEAERPRKHHSLPMAGPYSSSQTPWPS